MSEEAKNPITEKIESTKGGHFYKEIMKDFRIKESLHGCLNCGTCVANCPAAAFYDYSPREVCQMMIEGDEETIEEYMKSKIWNCAQCFSCKYRCPKENSAADIVMTMREIAVREGLAAEALAGYTRIAKLVLTRGNQLAPDMLSPDAFPDWGPRMIELSSKKMEMREELFKGFPGMNVVDRAWAAEDFTIYEMQRIWEESGALEKVGTVFPFLVDIVQDDMEDKKEEMEARIEAKKAKLAAAGK
jgi:heterodisulfide reductase subunit C